MLGSRLLIYPDTGDEFVRTLKLAALYSEQVRVLTLNHSHFMGGLYGKQAPLNSSDRIFVSDASLRKRLITYGRFVDSHQMDLKMLQDAGILVMSGPQTSRQVAEATRNSNEQIVKRFSQVFRSRGTAARREVTRYLESLWENLPPSHVDVIDAIVREIVRENKGHLSKSASYDAVATTDVATMSYFLTLIAISEQDGATLTTWSPRFQVALARIRTWFVDNAPGAADAPILDRRATAFRMASRVLERNIPSVQDISFEDILEVRSRCADELAMFRAAVASLATEIDVRQSPAEWELAIEDTISRKIDPAVQELTASMKNLLLTYLKGAYRDWKKLSAGMATVVISYSATGSMNASTLAGLALVAGPLIGDYAIERQKLLNASQWSLVYKLHKRRKQTHL